MEKIIEWVGEHATVLCGGAFAFIISLISHREGTWMDRISGSILCSLFSTGLFYGIVSFFPNCPEVAAVAIGSFVGFFGVDECKRIILDKIKMFLAPANKQHRGNNDEAE